MKAALPPDEAGRLSALALYGILDTTPEPAFDDLTLLAMQVCQTPTSMVTLVDEQRQWFKSRRGLDPAETPRDLALCAHTILGRDVMVVFDATLDERFSDNALVTGPPHLRFYAGVPLIDAAGFAVGTLAVIDYAPRRLTDDQCEALRALGRQAVAQLALRKRLLDERRLANDTLQSAEQHIRLVESRHRRLVESNVIGVIVARADGRLEEANERFLGMIGYTEEELRDGRVTWGAITPPDGMAEARRVLDEVRRSGACPPREAEFLHRDGHRVPVLVALARLDGAPGDCIGVVADLTERRESEAQRHRLEAKIQQAQKMEAVGQLAGGVAHDFNNILAAILGNVELARMDVPAGHPARISLDEIGRAGERAKSLVRQILAFGRRQPPDRRVICLRTLVDEVVGMLRASMPRNVELVDVVAEPLPAVCADETQVHQALLNLCTNAWHALEGRPGRIEIRLDAVNVGAALVRRHPDLRVGPYVRIRVTDTGKGMDAATQERLFEPFFTTKPRGQGTGLGLPVVHGIVRGHGGAIAVESAPGRGATFDLYFPAAPAPVVTPRPPPDSPPVSLPRGGERHVLYLDDEEALVLLVTRALVRRGYRVSGFTRPVDALAALRADPAAFDLAVTDYNMPGASGLEVAADIARLRPDLPVAIASGYVTDELREQAARIGVRQLIYKPKTVDELCAIIDRLTAKAREP